MVTSATSPSHHRKEKTVKTRSILSLTAAVQTMWPYQWLLLRYIAYPLTRRIHNNRAILTTVRQL